MNVLHISSAKTLRGGEKQLIYLINNLKNYRVNNYLACPSGSQLSKQNIDGLHQGITYLKVSPLNIVVPAFIKRICEDHSIDIVHVHDPHSMQYIYMSYFFFKNKVPSVVTRRVSFSVKASSLRFYNHPLIKKIICISKSVKESLVTSGISSDKMVVIPSGISKTLKKKTGLREQLQISNSDILIGNFTALSLEKDLLTFIEVAKELLSKESNHLLKFVIAGNDAGARAELVKRISTLGLEDKILMPGYIDKAEQYMHELDVLLCTSKSEGMGNVVLEAFKHKVPVVATSCSGIVDIIENNKTGLLAPIGDHLTLAKAIQLILDDTKLKNELVINAEATLEKFEIESLSSEVYNCYSSSI